MSFAHRTGKVQMTWPTQNMPRVAPRTEIFQRPGGLVRPKML